MPPPSLPRPRVRNTQVSRSMGSLASGSDVSHSSGFSETTRGQVEALYEEKCFACAVPYPEIAHVIPKADHAIEVWVQRGLVDFPLNSLTNAVPLCPTCHSQFDNHLDPGFVFVPKDLQYFIDYEREDHERRKNAIIEGACAQIHVPTAAMYKEHQSKKGVIQSDATAGLYTRIFVKEYMWPGFFENFKQPLPWHGAPIASLRKAFLLLSSCRIGSVDATLIKQLTTLFYLYFVNTDAEGPFPPGDKSTDGNKLETNHKKHRIDSPESKDVEKNPLFSTDHHTGDGELPGEASHKRRCVRAEAAAEIACSKNPLDTRDEEVTKNGAENRWARTYCPILRREVTAYWTLGPDCTAQDVIQRFGPIFARRESV
ncbi:hypothetical protein BDW42DRAFT_174029 [Aspergillus taichungensis]|uniref:HNH nuclease domain-containing protein n=1 Tax=Aspergillus taichungensis TaxID=482145 RepID=A0A2J5HNR0_9EURO|nr:hypothetical protein BDW42DRAFT_174029 [Aspergillus taichungensis]